MPYSFFSLATLFKYLLMHAYITCYQIFFAIIFSFNFFGSHRTITVLPYEKKAYVIVRLQTGLTITIVTIIALKYFFT